MKKMNEKKGFTLAELLIVVAIIAILVAVAIPVFTAQLNKSKLATATANARSAYAEYVASALGDSSTPNQAGLQAAINAVGSGLQGATATVGSGTVTVHLDGVSPDNTFSIDDDIH